MSVPKLPCLDTSAVGDYIEGNDLRVPCTGVKGGLPGASLHASQFNPTANPKKLSEFTQSAR